MIDKTPILNIPPKVFGDKHFASEFNRFRRFLLDLADDANARAAGYKGYLKLSDAEPTQSGLYRLMEIGTYVNLTPAVDFNGDPTTIVTEDGYINEAYFDGTKWLQNSISLPEAPHNLRIYEDLPNGTVLNVKEQVISNNIQYIVLQSATVGIDLPTGLKFKALGGGLPEEINRDFNESYFSNPGLYEDANEAAYYKNTGKIKLSAGAVLTVHISGDDAWHPKVAGIIVLKNNAVIQRIFTGNPNQWVTLTYVAPEDVEVVINHRYVGAFATGYYYHIFYKPIYGMKDLNVTGGVLGFDLYKNAVYATKAYTIEDDYIWKNGQVLTNGQIQDTNGIERRTDYLPVVQGQVVKVESRIGTNACAIAFYNTSKTFVSGIAGNDEANVYTFTAPQDGYVIIGTYIVNNFIGNFRGVDVSLDVKKIVSENNIDASSGISSVTTGASKKSFVIPQNYPTNGMLSIIDDDGNADVINYLLPLMQSKGLPIGLAIAGKLIDDGNLSGRPSMTEAQLISIKDNPSIEIMNHTYSHIPVSSSSKYLIYDEINKNHNWLLQRGILAESFVSPFGSFNINTLDVVSKLYDSHYSTSPITNGSINFRNLEIGRIDFGSGGTPLATIKTLIDRAKLKNEYIVIMTHVNGFNHYPNWRADFENLLDYIVASGITVLKPTDAFNRFKNMFERYGDYKIGADGMKRKY